MKKKKLFCWCDFLVNTGFGVVAKNLLDNMHEEYDVQILGINHHGDTRYDTSKYFVYPISRDDMLGTKKLVNLIKREQPDIVFLFQDIFHVSDYIEKVRAVLNPASKIVVYFPIDGQPFSKAWGNVFKVANAVITYSDWAIKVIKDRFPTINQVYKLYHGVDIKTYYPLPIKDLLGKKESFGWIGKFVVTNLNRFQPRKAIPLSVRAFSMFAKGYKVCKCGQHMPIDRTSCDLNPCSASDIIDVVKRDREDVFLYLHMMPNEPYMGPGRTNILQNHLLNAGFIDADVNRIIGVNASNIYSGAIPDNVVNDIYNVSNINFSSSLGEGCGLSLIEAAATGTPSIAPANSAIPEMLRDTGHLIPNRGLMNQAMDNGHLRPIVDTWAMTEALEIEYQKWKKSPNEKDPDTGCIANVQKNFLWKDKVDLLKEIFRKVLNS